MSSRICSRIVFNSYIFCIVAGESRYFSLSEYKTKIKGIYALLIGAIGYGFLVTILQMFLSERIKRDCKIILFKMDKVMGPFSDWIEDLFGKLWDIRNLIDNDVAGVIIAVTVYAIAAILLFLIFVVAPIIGMILLGLKYYEEIGDYVTVAFHLVLICTNSVVGRFL